MPSVLKSMYGKLPDVSRYLVEKLPGCGRTQLTKLLYLADVESRRHLGESLTNLHYILWDHGPFHSDILACLELMSTAGDLNEEEVGDGYRYSAAVRTDGSQLGKKEAAILDYVLSRYGKAPRKKLHKVVYETAPMMDAVERDGWGRLLRMELVEHEPTVPGLNLDRVIRSVEQLDRGEGRTLDELVAERRP